MIESSRNNSLPLWIFIVSNHCKSFTCASLSIGKDGAIKPFQGILDQRISTGLINRVLFRFNTIDIIKDEIFDISAFFDTEDVVFGLDTKGRIELSLSFVKGPNPQCNLHRFIFWCLHSIKVYLFNIYIRL